MCVCVCVCSSWYNNWVSQNFINKFGLIVKKKTWILETRIIQICLQCTPGLGPVPSSLVTFFLCFISYLLTFSLSLFFFFELCYVCHSPLIDVFMPKKEWTIQEHCRTFPRHSESRRLKSYVFSPCLGKWYYKIIVNLLTPNDPFRGRTHC